MPREARRRLVHKHWVGNILYVYTRNKLESRFKKYATAALAGYMIHANSLGRATLTGRYGRPAAPVR